MRRISAQVQPLLSSTAPVVLLACALLAGCTAAAPEIALAQSSALTGKTVFLDPGHNGANDASIDTQVPTGRGGTKNCQTTGTATASGYPEHTFNWQVVQLMRTELEGLGARVVLSRADDTDVASCVDKRAEDANASGADAVVSVHADGGAPGGHGFHVNYSDPPLNPTQTGPSVVLATTMRDALRAAGLTPSTYLGTDGLYPRADLTGLNLAQRPSILVELGNMRNADEGAHMESEDGRRQYARAVVSGIVDYLRPRA